MKQRLAQAFEQGFDLGVGILFVALALFFTHKGSEAKEGRGNGH